MRELSPLAQTILWVFLCFIIAINLSLVFAIRNRNRQRTTHREEHKRMPWESKDEESAAELARRVANLPKDGEEPPPKKPPSP